MLKPQIQGQGIIQAQAVPLSEGYVKLGYILGGSEIVAYGRVVSAYPDSDNVCLAGKPTGAQVVGILVRDDAGVENNIGHTEGCIGGFPCSVLARGVVALSDYDIKSPNAQALPSLNSQVGYNTATGDIEFVAAYGTFDAGFEKLEGAKILQIKTGSGVLLEIGGGVNGQGGGTDDYNQLGNKPQVNGVMLAGNKTSEELGINIPDVSGFATKTELQAGLDDKQDTLVSGTNIKTINNIPVLGSGNIDIQGGGDNGIFYAVKDVTTFAELSAAIQANKIIVIKWSESATTKETLVAGGIRLLGTSIQLTTWFTYESILRFTVRNTDVWEYQSIPIQEKEVYTWEDGWEFYQNGSLFKARKTFENQFLEITNASGNFYRSEPIEVVFPTSIATAYKLRRFETLNIGIVRASYPVMVTFESITETGFKYYAVSGGSRNRTGNYTIFVDLQARIDKR